MEMFLVIIQDVRVSFIYNYSLEIQYKLCTIHIVNCYMLHVTYPHSCPPHCSRLTTMSRPESGWKPILP